MYLRSQIFWVIFEVVGQLLEWCDKRHLTKITATVAEINNPYKWECWQGDLSVEDLQLSLKLKNSSPEVSCILISRLKCMVGIWIPFTSVYFIKWEILPHWTRIPKGVFNCSLYLMIFLAVIFVYFKWFAIETSSEYPQLCDKCRKFKLLLIQENFMQ